MSECGPNCLCGNHVAPVPPPRKSLRRGRCEAKQDYKTDSHGNMDVLICNRRKGHVGSHRAVSVGYGEKLFWRGRGAAAPEGEKSK